MGSHPYGWDFPTDISTYVGLKELYMNENTIIKALNSLHYDFEPMDDKFSRYDAFDKERGIMLEIKCRNKHYSDTLLEKMKYEWNKKFAKEHDLDFLYAVSMPTNRVNNYIVYIFDPINMEEIDEYDFKWHIKKLPQNTKFKGREWIDKEVGYLHIDDAIMSLTEKTTH